MDLYIPYKLENQMKNGVAEASLMQFYHNYKFELLLNYILWLLAAFLSYK